MNENIKNIISSSIADVVFKPIVGETTTFYKDPNIKDWAESEYAWCERPCDSNMSMRAIDKKGSIVGYASEHYWTWCDVKEVKKVSAIEFMQHFASKQSETVKEFAEKLKDEIAQIVNKPNIGETDEEYESIEDFKNGVNKTTELINDLAEQYGKEEI